MTISSDLLRKMQSKLTDSTDMPSVITHTGWRIWCLRMCTAQISLHGSLLHEAQLGASWKWLLVWKRHSLASLSNSAFSDITLSPWYFEIGHSGSIYTLKVANAINKGLKKTFYGINC